MATSAPPLGKNLASSDKKIRDKAVRGLSSFICDEANGQLAPSEMAKLWKGIFYCFWMSDKPLVQQALASDLANILLSIPNLDSALEFLRGFWVAIVREWTGIDRLRLDKFYMLIRRYVNASFRLLLRNKWDLSVFSAYNGILLDPTGPLFPTDLKTPASLQYHLADIYLIELDKVLSAFPEGEPPVPILTIVYPFYQLAAQTHSNVALKRVQSALLEPLLSAFELASSSPKYRANPETQRKRQKLNDKTQPSEHAAAGETDDEEIAEFAYQNIIAHSTVSDDPSSSASPSSPDKVYRALIQGLFHSASQETTKDSNRRKLYAICKKAREAMDEDGGDD